MSGIEPEHEPRKGKILSNIHVHSDRSFREWMAEQKTITTEEANEQAQPTTVKTTAEPTA